MKGMMGSSLIVCLCGLTFVYVNRSRTNRVKHLSRVAAEFTQMLYHVDKARSEKCAFVDEIQWVCEPLLDWQESSAPLTIFLFGCSAWIE
jgi:hypothetical protein